MSTNKRGRPPIAEAAMNSPVRVRLTPALRLELRRIADESGGGVAGVIREAIAEYVEEEEERRGRARRAGD